MYSTVEICKNAVLWDKAVFTIMIILAFKELRILSHDYSRPYEKHQENPDPSIIPSTGFLYRQELNINHVSQLPVWTITQSQSNFVI
jgi:hypothetical protein